MSGFLVALKKAAADAESAGVTVRSATGETAPTMLSLESRAEMAAKLEAEVEAAKEARAAAADAFAARRAEREAFLAAALGGSAAAAEVDTPRTAAAKGKKK